MRILEKNSVVKNNSILRKEMKEFRNSLLKQEVLARSRWIEAALEKKMKENAYSDIEHFLCFYPLEREVYLLDLYDKLLNMGKHLYFPVTMDENITFYEVTDMNAFTQGAFHVMEPNIRDCVYENDKAIALIPGLVFDMHKNRMGYGRGYYDRFLEKHANVIKWAVAFHEQVVKKMSVNDWDVPMDQIFTD